MGSYARFEHYLTTLEMETCPGFWPPSTTVFWPTVRGATATPTESFSRLCLRLAEPGNYASAHAAHL